ncbi:peptidoglycan-binding domain-containing protein [Chordicoccus furentiruminis]|uniref:peptidoglycan-binding domain-containing protein n=1 Tax=Chordicoccus furentiruminis TaxID=2709410 RepID=UPI0023A8EFD1|nr:peptidoglycan-binding domain-containing protein [Chordicoccus furentiruminis]
MKKRRLFAVAVMTASVLVSVPAFADITTDISSAEAALGIDNSDKKAIDRVSSLEDELGITDKTGTLAERLARIDEQLGIGSNAAPDSVESSASGMEGTESVSASGAEAAIDTDEKLAVSPTDDFVISRLKLIGSITDMEAVTEDHDPNGLLHKQGGYTGCIYFRDSAVNWSQLYVGTDDVIEVGTEGGGCIEIYGDAAGAEARNTYLAGFDGSLIASGSHKVLGTCIVRTSNKLTASQQNDLTDRISLALTAKDPTVLDLSDGTDAEESGAASSETNLTEATAGAAAESGASSAAAADSKDTPFVLYNQDGYTIELLGYDPEGQYNMGPALTMKITNLTHHNVEISDTNPYVNGAAMSTGPSFEIAAGKTETQSVNFWSEDLKNAGITAIEDISFTFLVTDNDNYNELGTIGPLHVSIDENGRIVNKVVYTDKATVAEVQSLLNAAGYNCGNADGVAGKNTNNQILKYEQDHGLREDTDITDELLASLRGQGS